MAGRGTDTGKAKDGDSREARLARQLRQNLKRRKAQARARKDRTQDDEGSGGGAREPSEG